MSATTAAKTKTVIPLTSDAQNTRKIPQAIFIENTEAWVEKYGSDEIIA